jgi:soluble lytic murein transglycosylase-like protein
MGKFINRILIGAVVGFSIGAFINTLRLQNEVEELGEDIQALAGVNKRLDKMEPQQAKMFIDVLHMKGQLEDYTILIDHQKQRNVKIAKVREIIKKTVEETKNAPEFKDAPVSREDIYTMSVAVVDQAERYGVPTNLLLGVLRQESAFNPNATSTTGARGLGQILPSTAEDISKKLKMEEYDLADVRNNIQFSAFYLSTLLDKYERADLATMAYTAGAENVDKFLRGEVEQIPHDASKYSELVMGFANNYRNIGVR